MQAGLPRLVPAARGLQSPARDGDHRRQQDHDLQGHPLRDRASGSFCSRRPQGPLRSSSWVRFNWAFRLQAQPFHRPADVRVLKALQYHSYRLSAVAKNASAGRRVVRARWARLQRRWACRTMRRCRSSCSSAEAAAAGVDHHQAVRGGPARQAWH